MQLSLQESHPVTFSSPALSPCQSSCTFVLLGASPDCPTELRQDQGASSEGWPHGVMGSFTPPGTQPWSCSLSLSLEYCLSAPQESQLAGQSGAGSCSSGIVWGSMEGEGELTWKVLRVEGLPRLCQLTVPLFLPAWVQIDYRASFLTSPSPLELVSPANWQRTLQTSPHLHFNIFTTSSHAALLTVPHIPPLSFSSPSLLLFFSLCP